MSEVCKLDVVEYGVDYDGLGILMKTAYEDMSNEDKLISAELGLLPLSQPISKIDKYKFI